MRLSQSRLVVVFMLLMMTLAAPNAFGSVQTLKSSPMLAVEGERIPNRYIIVLKDGANPRSVAAITGVNPTHLYTAALNGFAAELNAGQLTALQHNPQVAYIEQDQEVTLDATQYMDANGDPWGLDRIDQLNLPLSRSYTYNVTGGGVTVYIIDTGLQANHPDFGHRAANVFDAFGQGGGDCHGHGTHVAGTIGGATWGVAKQVHLRGVRVFDCWGSGTASGSIAGVDWVRANAHKPAVANFSLSGDYSEALNTAVANLVNSGVFVVVSAGNHYGDACLASPASTLEAYTVAASNKTDAHAMFSPDDGSNYGSCVDIYAPGVDIKSTWIRSSTELLSGTSMASAHVAGVAALYKRVYGDASSTTISNWLSTNATQGVISGIPANTVNRLLHVPPLPTPKPTRHDYDGDGIADLSIKTGSGYWAIDYAITHFRGWDVSMPGYGDDAARPAPADYDGDGKTDLGVKGDSGQWLIDYASNGFGVWDVNMSGYGDYRARPAPADYDGDGKADISVKGDNGQWLIDYASNGFGVWDVNKYGYGDYRARPAPADYDGDSKADISVKGDSGQWLIDYASNGFGAWDVNKYGYGGETHKAAPADYDGDGKADISTKTDNGQWLIDYASDGFGAWNVNTSGYGTHWTHSAIPADYDGDGRADMCVRVENQWRIDFAYNGFGKLDLVLYY